MVAVRSNPTGVAEHDFERALAEGRGTDAAHLAVQLARGRVRGVHASVARLKRTRETAGLGWEARIALERELAMLHARAGRFDLAFETMTLGLSLAQEADEVEQVCEAEIRGAFFAVQVRELGAAHDLLDNAEKHAFALPDPSRLGATRAVRGIALLAEDEADAAVELLGCGLRGLVEADGVERAFFLRQYARALLRADRPAAEAVEPLLWALHSARRRDDHPQLADGLETFAALRLDAHPAARALGAAATLRVRAACVRWADEADEAAAARDWAGEACGARAEELVEQGGRDPDAAVQATVARLRAQRETNRTR